MRKFAYAAVLGVAATGLMLSVPSVSKAEHRHRSRFGISVGVGGAYFSYNRGGHSHFGYDPYRYSGRYYGGPGVIYHHDYSHWTPRRGRHSHGHYHVVPRYGHGHGHYDPWCDW